MSKALSLFYVLCSLFTNVVPTASMTTIVSFLKQMLFYAFIGRWHSRRNKSGKQQQKKNQERQEVQQR
jgi:hypothetical protein